MRKTSPFTPGYGGMPPYLAGRESAQAVFTQALDELRAGKPNRGIVMYGPRGMGKTVLLGWFEAQCRKAGIAPISTVPALGLRSDDDLPRLLLPRDWLPGKVAFNMGNILSAQWDIKDSDGRKVYGTLAEHLAAACGKTPRALLLDEAHTLDKGVCQALLGLAQSVAAHAPFLLALAGTPGLMPFLGAVGATFVGRSKEVGIGTLSAQTAVDAIRIPLKEHGVAITDDALAVIVEDSQRYPFFLQEWGEALWRDAVQERQLTEVRQKDLSAAGGIVRATRENFYAKRFMSMADDDHLLAAADALAQAFKAKAALSVNEVKVVIRKSLAGLIADADARRAKAGELERELNRIDYIWYPPGGKARPGIPSFMAYVSEQCAEKAALENTDALS